MQVPWHSKHTEINSLASGGYWSTQGFTKKKPVKCFGKQKKNIYSWEKKDKGQITLPKLLKLKRVRRAKI